MKRNAFFEDTSLAASLKRTRKEAKKKSASEPKAKKPTIQKKKKEFGCAECGLDKTCITPYMKGSGNPKAKILIIGEAPGEREDHDGKPFVGKSGRFLKDCLIDAGIDTENHCFITNACRCRPVGNETPSSKQILCCASKLRKDIETVQPEIILLVGGKALEAVIGKEEITKYRGFLIPFKDYKTILLPTFHPSFINRNKDFSEMCFRDDIQKLKTYKPYAAYDMNDYKENHKILTTIQELDTLLNEVKNHTFAIDFETTSSTPDIERRDQLKPFNVSSRILICAITYKNDMSYSFDITEDTLPYLKKFFSLPSVKIMHNFKFEQIWGLVKGGTGLFDIKTVHDTMYFSYLLNEIKGIHSLDFQSFARLGLHKSTEMDAYKTHMEDAPHDEAHQYAGLDVKLTYRLHNVLYPELQKYPKLLKVYNTILAPGAQATTLSELEGVYIDWDKVEEVKGKYEEYIKNCLRKIYTLPEVVTYKAKHDKFNLKSTPDMVKFMHETGRGAAMTKTEKNNFSADAFVLKELSGKGDKFCQLLLQFRDLGKAHSTYMKGLKKFVYDDGLLHTDYNLHGTETGRLSSSSPNLQNIDKHKHKEIRTFFVPPKNHLIMSFDYAGAELRGYGIASQDENMQKDIVHGDIHGDWAKKLFNVTNNDIKWKEWRHKSKNQFVFPLLYGSSAKSIAESLVIPEDKLRVYYEAFYERYSGLRNYHREVIQFYKKHGYVETVFGRIRRAPLRYNQIINTPIQSMMSDFTLLSMIRVIKAGYKCSLMIHDDLTIYVPENRIKESFEEVSELMTNYDFKFLTIPLEVECSIGENWGELIGIEQIL